MSLEPPNRALQASSQSPNARASQESVRPSPLPLTVAQSIEHKDSLPVVKESSSQRQEVESPFDEVTIGRPSLHSVRSAWRSAKGHAWVADDRDDRRGYSSINSCDFGSPPKAPAPKEGDANYDNRYPYYDHPYYSQPNTGSINSRNKKARPSWRSSATITALPKPGEPESTKHAGDEFGDETDDEEPQAPTKKVQQRPLTWGYEGTPPPPPPPSADDILRLPFTWWMNSGVKDHFVAFLSEFVGTTMFLFFAFAGTQVANINADAASSASTTNASNGFSPIVLTYIALSFGFSLMVNVWIFYRISGGLFNPAVTLGMVMVKSLSYTRGLLLVGAQILGSIITSLIVKALFPVNFNVRTTLSADTSLVQGVFIEGLLTAELVFAIFMLAKEKHRATHLAPIGIGIALFIAELVGVYYTGGSLNPARSFGPCVVTGIWDKEHWIYWVGPAGGAVGAVFFYNFIKVLEYEMANPGQDSASEQKAESEAKKLKEKKKEEEEIEKGEMV